VYKLQQAAQRAALDAARPALLARPNAQQGKRSENFVSASWKEERGEKLEHRHRGDDDARWMPSAI